MLLAAARYGYPNAKVRGLRSRRLTGEDRHFLLTAPDLSTFLSYLGTTSYGMFFADPRQGNLQPSALERQLSYPLLEHYAQIIRFLPGKKERALVLALFRRFEAENLKLVLRSLFTGLTKEAVAHLLYPLGRLSSLNWQLLWTSASFAELTAHLDAHLFGRALRHALPQFDIQGRLFPLEMALDFSCFHGLQQAVDKLKGGADHRAAANIVGAVMDILNVSWVIRLQTTFGLSPEEIINYTLPPGKRVTLAILNQLARTKDLATFISLLPVVLQREMTDVRHWSTISIRLQAWFLRLLIRIFTGPPFHIGIAVAYLLEKELELTSLISLLQAKAQNWSIEEAAQLLPEQFMEGLHVQAG